MQLYGYSKLYWIEASGYTLPSGDSFVTLYRALETVDTHWSSEAVVDRVWKQYNNITDYGYSMARDIMMSGVVTGYLICSYRASTNLEATYQSITNTGTDTTWITEIKTSGRTL